MGIPWGAPALESLMPPEMWAGIQSVQVDPAVPTEEKDAIQFVHGETGQLMAKIPANKFYRLRRSKLRECLVEGVDIEFNKNVNNITFSSSLSDSPTVTAQFSDGSQQSRSLVVVADGANSTVRRLLLEAEKAALVRLPYGNVRSIDLPLRTGFVSAPISSTLYRSNPPPWTLRLLRPPARS